MNPLRDPDAVALLERAVGTPSVSGAEAAVAELFVEAMRGYGAKAAVDAAGNAVGSVGDGPVNVVFLGHIDTVPGQIAVRREGDLLYGRGAVDAKGPFCTAVVAASRLSAAARAALTVTLVGAVEEEVSSSRGARHAVSTLPKPAFVIIGEPSGHDAVTLGYKGRLVAEVTAVTERVHSATDVPTAAELVVDAWSQLKRWAQEATPETAGIFDAVQVTLQGISSEDDGLEERARATIGFRLPPAWPPDDAVAALEAMRSPPPVRVAFTGAEQPYRGPRDTPLTRAFRVALRAAGLKPRTNVKTGTSDMNVVAPVWNVPMLAYGPGDASLDHTPNEHVAVPDYLKAVTVLTHALETLAEQVPATAGQTPERS